MLELSGSSLVFHFPEVHPCARVTITFVRTLRIPDNDKTYNCRRPRVFPVRRSKTSRTRLPEKWKKRGGVMLPMYQAEAMWMKFDGAPDRRRGSLPVRDQGGDGQASAITGEPWSKKLRRERLLRRPKLSHGWTGTWSTRADPAVRGGAARRRLYGRGADHGQGRVRWPSDRGHADARSSTSVGSPSARRRRRTTGSFVAWASAAARPWAT